MIYKAFGCKQQLMKAVYDVTVAGDLEPIPMAERAVLKHVLRTADPRERIELFAGFVRDFHERLGGLLTVLTEVDPEVAEVRAATENERLTGLRAFVAKLADEGHLRPATTVEQAADACWTLTSPQVFSQLTQSRSWSLDTYQQWLAEMLTATLVP
jgi:AcrR family transcriptional regulator